MPTAPPVHTDTFVRNASEQYEARLVTLEVLGRQDVVLLIRNFSNFLELEKADKREAALQVFRDAEVLENRYDGVRFRVIGLR